MGKRTDLQDQPAAKTNMARERHRLLAWVASAIVLIVGSAAVLLLVMV